MSPMYANISYGHSICFNLICVFISGCAGSLLLCGLFSLVVSRQLLSNCCVQASHGSGFSFCGARLWGKQASGIAAGGLNSWDSWTPEQRLKSCGARTYLLCMKDLHQIRDQTRSSFIGRQILYHWATRKAWSHYFLKHKFWSFLQVCVFLVTIKLQEVFLIYPGKLLGNNIRVNCIAGCNMYPCLDCYLSSL